MPAVSANITNTVALCPGYLGGALAQRTELEGQQARARKLLLAAAVGGLLGSILLVLTSESVFESLGAVADPRRDGAAGPPGSPPRLAPHRGGAQRGAAPCTTRVWLPLPVFACAIYGGYFGAGLGIMLLAVLGLCIHERLNRLNALKQVLSLVINVVAALFFVFSGKVYWGFALVMAVGALVGGHLGGSVAHRLDPKALRAVVVVLGTIVGVVYLVR